MVRPVMRRVQRESAGNGRPSFSQRMVGFGYPEAMQGSSTLCPTCTSPDWKLSSTDGVDSVGSVGYKGHKKVLLISKTKNLKN